MATYTTNITNQHDWYGNIYQPGDKMLITIQEPLVRKTNSFKALASVDAVLKNGYWQNTTGDLLVYFKKDSMPAHISYGSQILTGNNLQTISNSGNPGAFDYKRYCLFHNITAQTFLAEDAYKILPGKNINWLKQILFALRDGTINILQKYIPGQREQGVAEALLIGYREDLDKDIVQAYSNTGVVHIIAISGLHLGMIYGLLVWIFSIFKRNKFTNWFRPVVILFVLWLFTLVAGAVPSILRSAVMFSFIIIGEALNKKSNMYNTLASSAFCMLVFNPFMLWDVGFLLSYSAVLSIITFRKYIYNWLYYKNKLLNNLWSLASVTLSAQVLTIPVVIFYFHQFPNFFLITNFVVVPLSGFILYGEIILLIFAFITPLAKLIGYLLDIMLQAVNAFIENINALPFSVWNNIQLTILQTWFLLGIIICICLWLILKSSKAFVAALGFATSLTISLSIDLIQRNQQQKLIVYNVPKNQAIDVLQGSTCRFTGSSILLEDGFLRNFHLKPARTLYRASPSADSSAAIQENQITNINGKNILVLTKTLPSQPATTKIPVDIIVISKNPKLYINQLQQVFDCKKIVFDASNPLWKIQLWKKDCDSLHLRFHSTYSDGAFVMDL